MTRQTDLTDDETKAHMMVFAQSRIEDKEVMKEMSADIKGMSRDISKMAIAVTENIKDNHFTNRRVDTIETKQEEQGVQIQALNDTRLIKKIRWGMVGTIAAALAFVTTSLFSVALAAIDKISPFIEALIKISEKAI